MPPTRLVVSLPSQLSLAWCCESHLTYDHVYLISHRLVLSVYHYLSVPLLLVVLILLVVVTSLLS